MAGFVTICACVIGVNDAFAYIVPQDDSTVEYFYVIGPDGDPKKGAEDHLQVLHIDIPANGEEEVRIGVYDPGTGENVDAKKSRAHSWDTLTEITISGNKVVLDKQEFGDTGYDQKYYNFGPFSKTAGTDFGSFYRFTLEVKATTGDDANLFKVGVTPNSAKISSPNITFRLVAKQGAEMVFYPLIPEGTNQIIVKNFDLDEHGGTSRLTDPSNGLVYEINDSTSGQWSETPITLDSAKKRFLEYIIVKGTQIDAHAGLQITDADGNELPIYFRKDVAAPVAKKLETCNEFTFDATNSYDPDNQALSFHWDFGDGTTNDDAVTTHVFENGGDYNVTLTVKDNSGLECDTAIAVQPVHVNTPPDAAFSAPDIACTNQEVNFDAGSTTDDTPGQLTYNWDFGDGSSAEGQLATKVFTKGGEYQVRLFVNDNSVTSCSTDSAVKTIKINTPPIADAGKDVDLCLPYNQDYKISFDGSGSVDPDGDTLTYKWDFGDGTGDTGARVTHVYQSRGEYTATLFVEDGSGSTCSADADNVNVKLNKAPVAEAGNNVTVCQGTEILFDGTGSIGEDGEELSYSWDFGDGTKGEGTTVAHTYQTGGNYKTVLTVDDGQSTRCSVSSDSVFVIVNTQPSADLNGVDIACTGDTINFDASKTSDADGDSLTYIWDFGDGTVEQNGPKVSHVYTAGGNYSVRLLVDDKKGTECSKDMAAINVKVNTPPVADAGSNLVCCLNKESDFNGSGSSDADGNELSYAWDFGDGSTGEGAQVTHSYSKPGEYIVTLTVNDNSGTKCDTARDSFTAVVNAKPTPIIKFK